MTLMRLTDQYLLDCMNADVREMEGLIPREHLQFFFDEHWFGDQLWVAVIFEGNPIVGPFNVPGGLKGNIPYFAEEFGRYV